MVVKGALSNLSLCQDFLEYFYLLSHGEHLKPSLNGAAPVLVHRVPYYIALELLKNCVDELARQILLTKWLLILI